ncbi:MAG: 50S ribosomal protein L11 methyltransferase [Bacteroidota bacterium]
MDYIQLSLEIKPDYARDIVTAELSEYGFESFSEEGNILFGYIPHKNFSMDEVRKLPFFTNKLIKVGMMVRLIKAQNWNALWESNFEPVRIGNFCYIRAPFHKSTRGVDYQIVIEPKMSFGTGHHETTSLMVEMLADMDLNGKTVLDMGCGTGVLAILAKKMGATDVMAIDNDEWAYNNTVENIERNKVKKIVVKQGDASLLKGLKFDIIIANINRNVLLGDISGYSASLNKSGTLLMSGFYSEDLPMIKERCKQFKLRLVRSLTKNNWIAAGFTGGK